MRRAARICCYQFGEPQIDEMTQEQLAVKNIIVQYCSWKKYDDNAEYLDIDVVNGGMGTIYHKRKGHRRDMEQG